MESTNNSHNRLIVTPTAILNFVNNKSLQDEPTSWPCFQEGLAQMTGALSSRCLLAFAVAFPPLAWPGRFRSAADRPPHLASRLDRVRSRCSDAARIRRWRTDLGQRLAGDADQFDPAIRCPPLQRRQVRNQVAIDSPPGAADVDAGPPPARRPNSRGEPVRELGTRTQPGLAQADSNTARRSGRCDRIRVCSRSGMPDR